MHTVVDDLRFGETGNKMTLSILRLDNFLAHRTLNAYTRHQQHFMLQTVDS